MDTPYLANRYIVLSSCFQSSLSPQSRRGAKFRKGTLRNFATLRRCGKAHFGLLFHGLRRSWNVIRKIDDFRLGAV